MKTYAETREDLLMTNVTDTLTPKKLSPPANFEQIVKTMPLPYYTCDAFGYITFYNKAAVELWGKEPELGKDLWSAFWQFSDLPTRSGSLYNCPMAICLREQRQVPAETIAAKKHDGSHRVIKVHPQPLFNAEGNFIGAANMLFDVTDLASTTPSWTDKNEVDEILDTISDGFCSFDHNWIVNAWNKKAEVQTGIKKEDLIGTDYRQTLKNYLPETSILALTKALQEKKSVIFEQLLPQIGLWLQFSAFPSKTGMNLFVKDINQKKEQFKEVLAAKNNTTSLINASKDLLWSVDTEFKLIAANNAFKKMAEEQDGVAPKEGNSVLSSPFEDINLRWKSYYETSFKGASFFTEIESTDELSNTVRSKETCFNPIYDIERRKVVGVACSSRDVTERKEQERIIKEHYKLLKEKEEHLEKLAADLEKMINSSVDIICSVNAEGRFTNVNAASQSIWGYLPEELEGKRSVDFIADEYKERAIEEGEKIMKGAETTNLENVYIRKDGTRVPMLWSAKWDKKENLMFCIAKDATKIKDAERLRFETEQKFSALILKGADMISIVDEKGNYTYASSNVERIVGYKSEELIGKNAFTFIHPEDTEKVRADLASLLTSPEVKIADFRFRTSAGEWKWFEVIGTNMLNNEIINGIVINSRDITERKLQEEELVASHQRFEIVSKATNEAIWDYDITNDKLSWNDNYTKLYGHNKSAQSLESWKINIHPDDIENIWSSFGKIVSDPNNRHWKGEYRYKKANGKYAYVCFQSYILTDKNNKPIRLVGAMRDITDKKEIEIERELMIEELTNSNNDLKQFSFITSHNLRSPLSNIIGLLNVIDQGSLSEPNKNLVGLLEASALQLQETIRDLTDIIVIRNRPNIDQEQINIEKVFNNVQKNFLNTLHDIQNELSVNFEVKEAVLNKPYLESIFINLLSNAIKYRSPERVLKIQLKTSLTPDNNCLIEFSDNGMGLDHERLKSRLFGLYQRFHENIDGRGLGLFIVKSQVTSMGGTIDLHSEINKGTTLTISLPMKNN